MRRLVITQNITLDGVVDNARSWFDRPPTRRRTASCRRSPPSTLRAGLVDEIRLFVHPVVLGEGRRLFPGGWTPPGLALAESRAFSGGVLLLRYLLPR